MVREDGSWTWSLGVRGRTGIHVPIHIDEGLVDRRNDDEVRAESLLGGKTGLCCGRSGVGVVPAGRELLG